MHAQRRYTLTASCPDRVGIVARVATFIAENQGWILETSHHADEDTQRYFMRIEMKADSLPFDLAEFRRRFQPIAAEFRMDWRIADSAVRKRLVLLVSKQEHCLYDLLARWQSKELDVDIPCVISNHETFRGFVEWHGIPFHHVPVTAENKAVASAEIARLFEDAHGDVMVLARYMQIIPAELCEKLPGRIINIHHSFLPSFVGAKPYHQAHQRGVKLIGATCHFVTAELDAGPIIEQDTVRIDHGDTVDDLVRYGKDIEKAVLARGLRYHVEDRVLLNGNRTVVFR
ncbi:MAG: formyltetrahydrofolate deformylase [Rhodocyclaceae bacterium]|nr:formyltetrahydrofolate deformylase [Rhodocyclaceae bacterium]